MGSYGNSMGVARSGGAGRMPCAILMLFLALLPACAGGNGEPPADSTDPADSPVGTPLPSLDPRALPGPEETELFPDPVAERGNAAARRRNGIALAGAGAGILLSAFGVSALFRGAADGFDSSAMHTGLTVAVSGSLVAALFSALRDSTDQSDPGSK